MNTRNWVFAVLVAAVLMASMRCQKPVGVLDPTLYVGTWAGTWNNETFVGATGPVTVVVGLNTATRTLSFSVDVDGQALQQGDLPQVNFDGTYTETALSIDAATTPFGVLLVTVDGNGTVTGSAAPSTLDSVTFDGTWTETALDIEYTVFQPAGTVYAAGTAFLTKQL